MRRDHRNSEAQFSPAKKVERGVLLLLAQRTLTFWVSSAWLASGGEEAESDPSVWTSRRILEVACVATNVVCALCLAVWLSFDVVTTAWWWQRTTGNDASGRCSRLLSRDCCASFLRLRTEMAALCDDALSRPSLQWCRQGGHTLVRDCLVSLLVHCRRRRRPSRSNDDASSSHEQELIPLVSMEAMLVEGSNAPEWVSSSSSDAAASAFAAVGVRRLVHAPPPTAARRMDRGHSLPPVRDDTAASLLTSSSHPTTTMSSSRKAR